MGGQGVIAIAGGKASVRVDMQVRPVRMERSPATRLWTAGAPHHGRTLHRTPLGCGDTPLAALPSEGCPHVLSSGSTVQIASKPHAIVFPRWGKRSLIPPCGPSIRPRNCTNGRQFRDIRTSRATGSAHLPVDQAGGPPLDFEKTGLTLLGLRGGVGGTWRCQETGLTRTSYQFLGAWFLDERASRRLRGPVSGR